MFYINFKSSLKPCIISDDNSNIDYMSKECDLLKTNYMLKASVADNPSNLKAVIGTHELSFSNKKFISGQIMGQRLLKAVLFQPCNHVHISRKVFILLLNMVIRCFRRAWVSSRSLGHFNTSLNAKFKHLYLLGNKYSL